MSVKTVYKYTGPSTLSLLGIVFIVLKLTGHITWSWLWVLSPFWIPLVILLIVLFFLFILFLFSEMLKKIFKD